MAQPVAVRIPRAREALADTDALSGAASSCTARPVDGRLAERISRALQSTGRRALLEIEITVQARIVVLRGQVSSYYLKQVAQEIAMTVRGIRQIHNYLDVKESG